MATEGKDRHVQLQWFTHKILPNGRQICSIRPIVHDGEAAILCEQASQLMMALIGELARDHGVAFGPAKQAVLRAIHRNCLTVAAHTQATPPAIRSP